MHNGLILFNPVKGYIIMIIIWFPDFQKDRSCDCRSLTARRPYSGYWCANKYYYYIRCTPCPKCPASPSSVWPHHHNNYLRD